MTADDASAAMTNSTQPAQDEVIGLLSELIRINTSNPTHPERPAAEWVAQKLDEVGIDSVILESEPGRASTIARIKGTNPERSPLLIHGHLDVVPAEKTEWSVDPFAGEVKDGYVWGRGAVDMKDMDAMTLAIIRHWARSGVQPERDIVLAFVADEEAGGRQGAHWLVDNHADYFADCTEAISEVGGFSVTVGGDLRMARMIGASIRNTANPTGLTAGYKANVIPSSAEAVIDSRFLPGYEAELFDTIDSIIAEASGPGTSISREMITRDIAVETDFNGAIVDEMAAALRAEDPGAVVAPYLMSGGTDAKSFSGLGIRNFGYSPLLLPADLDFSSLFHGIDERVPVSSLQFGVRVLDRFLRAC
jgi:acetylornithine deacetylase/succinyl-diaminopimelate desuccinylase-like protein